MTRGVGRCATIILTWGVMVVGLSIFKSQVNAQVCDGTMTNCGSYMCGECPAGRDCRPGENCQGCCCSNGCYCVCDQNQCETGTGFGSPSCPDPSCCGGGGGPTPTGVPTPVPTSAATVRGTLTCRYGGVYPNRWAQVSTIEAWVGDGAGNVRRESTVTTNPSGNGSGSFVLPNFSISGAAFYVRTGFPSMNYGGGWPFFDGIDSQAGVGGCNSAFEGCQYSTIANRDVSGFNFQITDVDPTTMSVPVCGPSRTGPFTFRWKHADGNPARYRIVVNNASNGNAIDPPTDIRCFKNQGVLGCGDGTCEFTPPAANTGDGCSYVPGQTYNWWSVQPKTLNGDEYFCEQPLSLSCAGVTPTPTLIPTLTLTPTPTPSPTPLPGVASLRVNVYEAVGGSCSGTTALPPSATGTVRVYHATYDQPRNFPPLPALVNAIPIGGVYRVELINISSGWNPAPCGGSAVVSIPGAGVHERSLYLVSDEQPWWQALGGDVMANNGNITSILADNQRLSQRLGGVVGSAGMVARNNGTLSVGSHVGVQVREDKDWRVRSKYEADYQREGFSYFKNKFPWVDWTPNVNDAKKPPCHKETCGYLVANSIAIRNGSGTWANSWSTDEKMVIFVEGDLTIGQNLSLPESAILDGGFLAFVVEGDIVFEPGVTVAQGIYLADGNLVIQGVGADQAFAGRGTFVGWDHYPNYTGMKGVVLGRRPVDTNSPAERFEFWPQLVLNTPVEMTSTRRFFTEGIPRDLVTPTP